MHKSHQTFRRRVVEFLKNAFYWTERHASSISAQNVEMSGWLCPESCSEPPSCLKASNFCSWLLQMLQSSEDGICESPSIQTLNVMNSFFTPCLCNRKCFWIKVSLFLLDKTSLIVLLTHCKTRLSCKKYSEPQLAVTSVICCFHIFGAPLEFWPYLSNYIYQCLLRIWVEQIYSIWVVCSRDSSRLLVAGVWLDSAVCQILTCVDIKPFSE